MKPASEESQALKFFTQRNKTQRVNLTQGTGNFVLPELVDSQNVCANVTYG
jgi:hypothetical protein